jgi:nucleotide-binding universal stress UspA family protein
VSDPVIHTILCPTDFSIGSDEALRYALFLGRVHGAKVKIVHVDDYASLGLPGDGPLIEDRHEQLWAKLDEVAERHQGDGPKIERDLAHGTAYEAIVEYAGLADADLIVLGTHGRTGLSRMLLGSVAERVVRTSRIPVLTVRHPEYAAPAGGGVPVG